jgi:hypothetical protein
MKRLLCWIGLHDWDVVHPPTGYVAITPGTVRHCLTCPRAEEWNFWSNRTHGWERVR